MRASTATNAAPRWPRVWLVLLLAGCAAGGPAPVSDRPLPGATSQTPPRAVMTKPEPVAAPAPVATPISPPPKPEAGVQVKPLAAADAPTYTVRPGDTLYAIAKSNGVLVRDLAAWNNLDDPGSISVGQILRLGPRDGVTATPVKPPGAAESAPRSAEGNLKTQPLGQLVPYSEQAFTQMSKTQPAPKVEAKTEVKAAAKAEHKVEPKPQAKADSEAAAKPAPSAAANSDSDWIWPTEGKVIGTFNEGSNKGINISGKRGQPVFASAGGRVIFSGTGPRGFGRLIVIRHTSNFQSVYAHNEKLLVKEGQNVTKGQRIADMGSTDTDSVKLHFEIRRQGKPVDPTKLLPGT